MKRNISIGSAVIWSASLVLLAGCYYRGSFATRNFSNPQLKLTLNQEPTGGTWRLEGDWADALRRGTWMNVQVQDAASSWVLGFGLRPEELKLALELEDPKTPGALKGALRREGGTFAFSGRREADSASGIFQFEPDSTYVQQVQSLLTQKPSAQEWLLLALHDVTTANVRDIKNAGYSVAAKDILHLRQNGVPVEYLVALRRGGCVFSIDDILKFRRAGVQAEYPVTLKKAGFALPASEIVSLRHSGVAVEYFLTLKKADPALSTEQVVKLRHSGVAAEYFTDVRRLLPELSGSEIIKLRNSGISADYLKQWRNIDVSWEDVIKLRNASVPAEYATALKAAGYALAPDAIIKLRYAGVPTDYISAIKKAGFDFTWEELIQLRRAGVTAEYLAALHAPGQRNLSAEVIIDLRRRGVPAETVRQIRAQPN